jgi:NAD-dependent SIR2 family protein deacetylase
VTTVADRTHYCADHPDAELTQVHGSVGACVECPQCHRRICQGCNEVASECWSSGLCHGCYREASRRWEADKRQREADARERELVAEYERGRADQAAADRARIERLADALLRRSDLAADTALARAGLSDEQDLLRYGSTLYGIQAEVRAALDSEGGA